MNIANPPTSSNSDPAMLKVVPAANSDRLDDGLADSGSFQATGGGWDSYEVWRRFIKDARDRRERNPS
ncbi:MAG: hypothetical protein ABW034_26150 [Steroidobacteraceae bacterium]